MAEAAWGKTKKGSRQYAWRLHTHVEVKPYVPTRMDCTDARNQGASNEKAMRRRLAADHCYILDRGYAQFTLFNAMLPQALTAALQTHLHGVRQLQQKELAHGRGQVRLPEAFERKVPSATTDWRWQ